MSLHLYEMLTRLGQVCLTRIDENRQAFVVVVVTGVLVLMNLDIEDMRRVTATFDARRVQKELGNGKVSRWVDILFTLIFVYLRNISCPEIFQQCENKRCLVIRCLLLPRDFKPKISASAKACLLRL
jgi:hypothetical protein